MCIRLNKIIAARQKDASNWHKADSDLALWMDDSKNFVEHLYPYEDKSDRIPANSIRNKEGADALCAVAKFMLQALYKVDQFMRSTIQQLETFKAISTDPQCLEAPPQFTVDWLTHCEHLRHLIRLSYHDFSADEILGQRIHPPKALSAFLVFMEHMAHVNAQQTQRNGLPLPRYWYWPGISSEDFFLEDGYPASPYIDLERELQAIRELLGKQDSSQERIQRKNRTSAEQFVNHAFGLYSKVLVIRLDLHFKEGAHAPFWDDKNRLIEPAPAIDPKEFLNAFRDLESEIRNKYSTGYIGFIRKLEYAFDAGLHMHAFFFFNGHKHQQDISIANSIGELWSNTITKKNGRYWNCNKEYYTQNGIGMIERKDIAKQSVLLNQCISYLLKKDTLMKFINQEEFQSFRRSTIPKRKSTTNK